jgi:hypothetical protein
MGSLKRRIIESMEPTEHDLARRWIPVTERLPSDGVRVLIWEKSSVDFATWSLRLGWEYDDYGSPDPTHWMPLPEPPTAGE